MLLNPTVDLLSAMEASARLGISRASLYAYVSRGLIRSFGSPHDPRERLYAMQDVEALVQRRTRLRRPTAAAATALDWGLPVLETGLTQIRDGRLFYREREAVALAATATLEDAASLLIGKSLLPSKMSLPKELDPEPAFGSRNFPDKAIRMLAAARADSSSQEQLILRLMAFAGSGSDPGERPIHEHLSRSWDLSPALGEVLRQALVLCADHELSASAFAVRVCASTGASLKNAVIAGLASLSGPLHGGATEQVRQVLQACEQVKGQRELAERLSRRETIGGFRHPLYPDGDPRGQALLDALRKATSVPTTDLWLLDEVARATGDRPTIDVALVMAERACGMPEGAAFVLFAIGRTAGWLAHAVEQQSQGGLIRPRARYVVSEA